MKRKNKKTSLGPSQPPQLAHLTIPNLITYKRQPPAMSNNVAPNRPSSQPPPDMRCRQQDLTVGRTPPDLLPGSSSRSPPPRRPRAAATGSPPVILLPDTPKSNPKPPPPDLLLPPPPPFSFLFLLPSPLPYDEFQGDRTPYLRRALYRLGDALKTMVSAPRRKMNNEVSALASINPRESR
jgi:hypothetical protein